MMPLGGDLAILERIPTFLQPSIPWRNRLLHFTFAWYTVTWVPHSSFPVFVLFLFLPFPSYDVYSAGMCGGNDDNERES